MIFTRDNYIISYIRLYPINIELLSEEEKESRCNRLTGEFKGEQKKFAFLAIPRTLDMEEYMSFLSTALEEEITNVKRKMLLEIMVDEAAKKVMSTCNFEHQFFIQLWEKVEAGKEEQKIRQLEERITEFERRYDNIQNQTKVLDNTELLKMINMFTNSSTALFDMVSEDPYIPIPWIKKCK